MYDSQGRILALSFRYKSLKRFKGFEFPTSQDFEKGGGGGDAFGAGLGDNRGHHSIHAGGNSAHIIQSQPDSIGVWGGTRAIHFDQRLFLTRTGVLPTPS